MTHTLANTSTKNKRRDLDFYPTPPDATEVLIRFLNLPKDYAIWEPACGDGTMSRVIERLGYSVYSSDLRTDTGYGEQGKDFMSYEKPIGDIKAIITNPPFNKSESFIRKGLEFAPIVAMLLKSQYWHAKGRIVLFDKHPPAYVLPLTWRPDFMRGERGGKPTMEVLWTVWISGETDTRYRLLKKYSAQVGMPL